MGVEWCAYKKFEYPDCLGVGAYYMGVVVWVWWSLQFYVLKKSFVVAVIVVWAAVGGGGDRVWVCTSKNENQYFSKTQYKKGVSKCNKKSVSKVTLTRNMFFETFTNQKVLESKFPSNAY